MTGPLTSARVFPIAIDGPHRMDNSSTLPLLAMETLKTLQSVGLVLTSPTYIWGAIMFGLQGLGLTALVFAKWN